MKKRYITFVKNYDPTENTFGQRRCRELMPKTKLRKPPQTPLPTKPTHKVNGAAHI